MSSPPTINTLANEVGLTKQSVSHILNGKADKYRFSKETVEKVFKAARRLGYKPNAMARAVSTGSSNAIGFIHCSSKGKSYSPVFLMEGVQEELSNRGFNMVSNWISEESFQPRNIPRIFTELLVDGFLIDYIYPSESLLMRLIRKTRKPFLIINADLPRNCIRPDDYQAGYDLAMYLIKLGHKKILFLNFSGTSSQIEDGMCHYSQAHRYNGYRDAMIQSDLEPESVLADNYDKFVEMGYDVNPREVIPWFYSQKRPTAIILYNNIVGFSTLLRACDELGLKVPDDLSIVTISNIFAKLDVLWITTMVEPLREIGREAASTLLDAIESKAVGNIPVKKLPFSILEGKSCAAPGSKTAI